MKKHIVFILLGLFVASANAGLPKKILYVQSYKANLLSEPNFDAKLVANLTKGMQVTVISQKSNWVEVKFNKVLGWVPSMLLAPTQPIAKQSVLEGLQSGNHAQARKRASIQATAAATRGLHSERSRANTNENANYDALETVEKEIVNEQEVEQFHKELVNSD